MCQGASSAQFASLSLYLVYALYTAIVMFLLFILCLASHPEAIFLYQGTLTVLTQLEHMSLVFSQSHLVLDLSPDNEFIQLFGPLVLIWGLSALLTVWWRGQARPDSAHLKTQ